MRRFACPCRVFIGGNGGLVGFVWGGCYRPATRLESCLIFFCPIHLFWRFTILRAASTAWAGMCAEPCGLALVLALYVPLCKAQACHSKASAPHAL